jgi:signal transduction histidine kinase
MSDIPTFASLDEARARQRAAVRWLRPLGVAIVALVSAAAVRTSPEPALQGRGLGVALALIGFTAGWIVTMRVRSAPPALQVPAYTLLIASSAALMWLQPNGPGFLGVFIAVSAAAMRDGARVGAVVAGVALACVVVAGAAEGHRPVMSILLSCLGVTAFWVLALFARRLREGQDQAERMLVELEQTRTAQARAAVMAERQHLAREMHDVLAHTLSGLVLQLEGARLMVSRDGGDPELAEAVARAHRLARTGLDESRRAIGMLRGDELPGPERLDALTRDFERTSDVPCELEVTGPRRELGSDARLAVYRVAQEALTNVRKHAHPERVELHLGYEPEGTRLTVEDFGAVAPAAAANGGYGLAGMRERAELLGGRLDAAATPSGFRVELWVPA